MTTMTAAMRAEWIKAATLKSTWIGLSVFVLVVVGISVGVVASVGEQEAAQPDYDAGTIAFYGLNFGQVALITVAVLLTAGEYGRRTIHTSLVAVPQRGVFLVSKVAVATLMIFVTAAVTALVTFVGTQALLGSSAVTLATPGMARATLAAALYPTLLAVFCMGVALMMRDQATAISVLIPFFFLVSPLLQLVPVVSEAAAYLPDRAGARALQQHGEAAAAYGPLTGLAILALWAAAALLGAWWVLRRRDA
jgi:ABC-2 type transport system permease protein